MSVNPKLGHLTLAEIVARRIKREPKRNPLQFRNSRYHRRFQRWLMVVCPYCELCGDAIHDPNPTQDYIQYYSTEDCNETGVGVCLHRECCARLESVTPEARSWALRSNYVPVDLNPEGTARLDALLASHAQTCTLRPLGRS